MVLHLSPLPPHLLSFNARKQKAIRWQPLYLSLSPLAKLIPRGDVALLFAYILTLGFHPLSAHHSELLCSAESIQPLLREGESWGSSTRFQTRRSKMCQDEENIEIRSHGVARACTFSHRIPYFRHHLT